MKTNVTITMDIELYLMAKEQFNNLSGTINELLKELLIAKTPEVKKTLNIMELNQQLEEKSKKIEEKSKNLEKEFKKLEKKIEKRKREEEEETRKPYIDCGFEVS